MGHKLVGLGGLVHPECNEGNHPSSRCCKDSHADANWWALVGGLSLNSEVEPVQDHAQCLPQKIRRVRCLRLVSLT
jgi:hypothetical protein